MVSVTFLCPHNAAKSIAAAAYFRDAARTHGLDVTIASAGTDPDESVMGSVKNHLVLKGLWVESTPRLVTDEDLLADVVVNLGCDLTGRDIAGTLHSWDDVPPPSADIEGAMAAVAQRARLLAEAMAHT